MKTNRRFSRKTLILITVVVVLISFLPLNQISAAQSVFEQQMEQASSNTSETETGLIWEAGFEDGQVPPDIYVSKQGSGTYNTTTNVSHTGNRSASLTIDTSKYSSSGAHTANLVYMPQLPEDAYYYSGWYYIPSGVQPQSWWVIFEFMSTEANGTYMPMFILNPVDEGDNLKLELVYRPNKHDLKAVYKQNIMEIHSGRWFNLEMYYRKGYKNDGQVIVWQDGVEIFNVNNKTTVLSGDGIYWHVNNYTDSIQPNPMSIYVDDLAISTSRLGQAEPTATPTQEPTNTSEPTATPTQEPTNTPELTTTASLTQAPTNTPEPTAIVTQEPTNTPKFTYTPELTVTTSQEPTVTATACPSLPDGWVALVVQEGDTLENLAEIYGIDSRKLAIANCFPLTKQLAPGDMLFAPPNIARHPLPDGWVTLVVQEDDTLESLAAFYGIDTRELALGNCFPLSKQLAPGDVIFVPPNMAATKTFMPTSVICGAPDDWIAYTVLNGDTLIDLAEATGTTLAEIQYANCMEGRTNILLGQTLYLPALPDETTSVAPYTLEPTATETQEPTNEPEPTATATQEPTNSPEPTATTTKQPTNTPEPTVTLEPEVTLDRSGSHRNPQAPLWQMFQKLANMIRRRLSKVWRLKKLR